MLITFEQKVPQSSYTSQNDHKSKGYPSKTSAAAFTMQRADKGDLKRLSNRLSKIQLSSSSPDPFVVKDYENGLFFNTSLIYAFGRA